MTDIFYGLRSLAHNYRYNLGPKSILKTGISPADLTPKDAAYFESLDAEQRRLFENEQRALQHLASAQNTFAQRQALWGQYAGLNDNAKAYRLGAELDRKIASARNQNLLAEKKRTHAELLQANRQAAEAMRWRTVDTRATAANEANQSEQSWGA